MKNFDSFYSQWSDHWTFEISIKYHAVNIDSNSIWNLQHCWNCQNIFVSSRFCSYYIYGNYTISLSVEKRRKILFYTLMGSIRPFFSLSSEGELIDLSGWVARTRGYLRFWDLFCPTGKQRRRESKHLFPSRYAAC